MKNSIVHGWNFMRIIRLAMGIFIIFQGVQSDQWMFVIMGGLFSLMPLLNIGCNSTSGCRVPISKTNTKKEEITYEKNH